MRVYLAAPWVCKDEACTAATALESAGHTITKKWWEHREVDGYLAKNISIEAAEELAIQAMEDMTGVFNAQAFILLNTRTSEGKNVELGMALAYGTPVIVVGRPTNLFHYFPDTWFCQTIEDAIFGLSML